MASNRKTQVKSVSLDVLTIRRMEHALKLHFANQHGVGDLVSHAINDFCSRMEFAEESGPDNPSVQVKLMIPSINQIALETSSDIRTIVSVIRRNMKKVIESK